VAIQNYSVYWNTGAATTINTLSNVQTISIDQGRTWQTDPYSPTTCTIVARTTTAPAIGDFVRVMTGTAGIGSGTNLFTGTVKDIGIQYGNTTAMDFVTIQCEGALARWGRRQFTSRSLAQNPTLTQLSNLATAIGFNTFCTFNGTGSSTASAQTYSGNGLDLVNLVMTTEMGYIQETGTYTDTGSGTGTITPRINFWARQTLDAGANSMTDVSDDLSPSYDAIEFASATQRYYTEATINPIGLASQTSGSGFYSLTQDSVDFSTAQASSHAQYLVSQYNSTAFKPYKLTANYSNQINATAQGAFRTNLVQGTFIGALILVQHRGTGYLNVIEGQSISISPGETQLEITFSPLDNNNYLILNNATFGELNENKLGF
jgi:hypothetical protein